MTRSTYMRKVLLTSFYCSRNNKTRIKSEVIWLYGNIGSGKTEWRHNYLKDYNNLTLKNWYYGGLEGKQYLLYDKVKPTTQNHPTLLRMLDKYKVYFFTEDGEFILLKSTRICISIPWRTTTRTLQKNGQNNPLHSR
jgi:hypothetical protein